QGARTEALAEAFGQLLRQPLEQQRFAGADPFAQRGGDLGVVDGGGQLVARGGGGDVVVQLEVHQQRLAPDALVGVDPDHCLGPQAVDQEGARAHAATAGRLAMSQRGRTAMAGPSCWPAASLSAPAKAIMAPLSVQNSSRGKATRAPSSSPSAASAVRRRRLAPTPPDTTRVRAPVCSSARRHLIASVSTTASSKARATSARVCGDVSLS